MTDPAPAEGAVLKEIYLGEKGVACFLEIVREYAQANAPVSQVRRDELFRSVGCKRTSCMMVELRGKGVIITDSSGDETSTEHTRDVIPVLKGIVVVRKGIGQVWPALDASVPNQSVAPVQEALVEPEPVVEEPVVEDVGESDSPLVAETDPVEVPDPTLGAFQTASGAWVMPEGTEFVELSPMGFRACIVLMGIFRQRILAKDDTGMRAMALKDSLSEMVKSGHSMIHRLDQAGMLRTISGERHSKTSPSLRMFVFRPFFCKISKHEQVMIPTEFTTEFTNARTPVVNTPSPSPRLLTREELKKSIEDLEEELRCLHEDDLKRRLAPLREQQDAVREQISALTKRIEVLERESQSIAERIEDEQQVFSSNEFVDHTGKLELLLAKRVALSNYTNLVQALLV